MATNICGCSKLDGVFYPCPLHQQIEMTEIDKVRAELERWKSACGEYYQAKEKLADALKAANLQVGELQKKNDVLFSNHMDERESMNRLNERLQNTLEYIRDNEADGTPARRAAENALGGAIKRSCICLCHSVNSNSGGCSACGKHETVFIEKRVVSSKKCAVCGYTAHSGRCGEQGGSGPEDGYA